MRNSTGITVDFVAGPEAPPRQLGPVSQGQFNNARDLVVGVCARHGTVGPSGASSAGVLVLTSDPDFYVVDDQYGDDRRIFVEPRPSAISAEWLRDLASLSRDSPDWDVLAAPGEGISLLIRDGRITVSGWVSQARDLSGVVRDLCEYLHNSATERCEKKGRREKEVSRLLPEAWRMSQGKALGFVAGFRTRSDGSPGDSIWMLHFEDSSVFDLDDYTFEPDAVRPSVYWAGSAGTLTPYTPGSHPSSRDTALLAEWELVAGGKPVSGAKLLRLSKGDRAWTFDLLLH